MKVRIWHMLCEKPKIFGRWWASPEYQRFYINIVIVKSTWRKLLPNIGFNLPLSNITNTFHTVRAPGGRLEIRCQLIVIGLMPTQIWHRSSVRNFNSWPGCWYSTEMPLYRLLTHRWFIVYASASCFPLLKCPNILQIARLLECECII